MPKRCLAITFLVLALSIPSIPLTRADPGLSGGYNLGTSNPSTGNSLSYQGGEADTFKDNGDDVTAAFSNYRVYLTGSSTGSFITLNLPFGADINGNGDQVWQSRSAHNNLLSGLATGSYTMETHVGASTNQGDRVPNADGTNSAATFIAVPEPTVATLASAFGALALGLLMWPRLRRHA